MTVIRIHKKVISYEATDPYPSAPQPSTVSTPPRLNPCHSTKREPQMNVRIEDLRDSHGRRYTPMVAHGLQFEQAGLSEVPCLTLPGIHVHEHS